MTGICSLPWYWQGKSMSMCWLAGAVGWPATIFLSFVGFVLAVYITYRMVFK